MKFQEAIALHRKRKTSLLFRMTLMYYKSKLTWRFEKRILTNSNFRRSFLILKKTDHPDGVVLSHPKKIL